ncbi:MAG: phage BR0599 family protein [Pseudomonadota bacterium]
MSFADIEASTALGRPFFLYRFATTSTVLARLTGRDADFDDGSEIWTATRGLSHGPAVQSGKIEEARTEITLPLEDALAQTLLNRTRAEVVLVTIYQRHEGLAGSSNQIVVALGETTARLDGESLVVEVRPGWADGRKLGNAARVQRGCTHTLYGPGCNLILAAFQAPAMVTARTGSVFTVDPLPVLAPGRRLLGGILEHAGQRASIDRVTGNALRLTRRLPDLEAAVDAAAGAGVGILLAPGCARNTAACTALGNLANYGGFPEIPGENVFDGERAVDQVL